MLSVGLTMEFVILSQCDALFLLKLFRSVTSKSSSNSKNCEGCVVCPYCSR